MGARARCVRSRPICRLCCHLLRHVRHFGDRYYTRSGSMNPRGHRWGPFGRIPIKFRSKSNIILIKIRSNSGCKRCPRLRSKSHQILVAIRVESSRTLSPTGSRSNSDRIVIKIRHNFGCNHWQHWWPEFGWIPIGINRGLAGGSSAVTPKVSTPIEYNICRRSNTRSKEDDGEVGSTDHI